MTRREARETAFALLFESSFSEQDMDTVIADAQEAETLVPDDFAVSLATGAAANRETIDQRIKDASHKWSMQRISRVSISVMRLAVYEILYVDEIPVNVSINEAVELAKKYGGEEEAAFVNGVLGGIVKVTE